MKSGWRQTRRRVPDFLRKRASSSQYAVNPIKNLEPGVPRKGIWDVDFAAPALLRYEVINACLLASRRGRGGEQSWIELRVCCKGTGDQPVGGKGVDQ